MQALILRLDAVLMSFGGVRVDQHGVIDRFPGKSLLTGLLANALGWDHRDADQTQRLQDRLEFAARWDVPPEPLRDYQTVDLDQPKMKAPGWTTRGIPEHRANAKDGTYQREQHYWTDGVMTVAVSLADDLPPTLGALVAALQSPARPLFLGRKTCLPSRPLLDPDFPVMRGDDLLDILRLIPCWDRTGRPLPAPSRHEATWPAALNAAGQTERRHVPDLRDWANQLIVGSSPRAFGMIKGE